MLIRFSASNPLVILPNPPLAARGSWRMAGWRDKRAAQAAKQSGHERHVE